MFVEMNTEDDVFGNTISSPCGAIASMTRASLDPLGQNSPEIL